MRSCLSFANPARASGKQKAIVLATKPTENLQRAPGAKKGEKATSLLPGLPLLLAKKSILTKAQEQQIVLLTESVTDGTI